MAIRKIIHVDMDAFYASVEQRDFPKLRGKPVAVGGSSRRGVVAAASYEARKYGVYSAMSSVLAAKKCPDLIFVPHRFDVYREVSGQIRNIFKRYTDLVEPLSLDEAYLDVTKPKFGPPSATLIAQEIRAEIVRETALTASAGVSFNKFLAKVASDHQKPDGLTVITPKDAPGFIDRLRVEKFYGVGPVTARRMYKLGIRTGQDLRKWSEEDLLSHFGKAGRYYFRTVRCEDDRAVRTHRERKSLGAERTFEEDISDLNDLRIRLRRVTETVAERMENAGILAHTVTVKIKYFDFEITTRQTTSTDVVSNQSELFRIADLLLHHSPEPPVKAVRLIGVTVSNLRKIGDGPWPEQLKLEFTE